MNGKTYVMLVSAVAAVVVAVLISACPANEIISHSGKTTVVNTTSLGTDVRGFKGTTPVLIHIEKNKVVKVEALPNKETPRFFARAKAVLQQFEGLTVSKARKAQVDGVSGATFSSNALAKNVKLGLEYYQKNKSK